MDLGLRDRVAIVAASSRGFGKACARELACEGANVVLCARGRSQLEAVAEEISLETGVEVLSVRTDLRDSAQIQHLAAKTLRHFGRIDILVGNNGGPPPGFFDDFDDDAWLAAHQLTMMSAVRLIRVVLPSMRAQKWGRIINITSVSVKQPIDNLLFSNVYRPGVTGLAKTLSAQLAASGITVNNVAPGHTSTDRVVELSEARAKELGKSTAEVLDDVMASYPMQRMGKPEELAALVAFLASERAGFITGTTIPVDGGYVKGLL